MLYAFRSEEVAQAYREYQESLPADAACGLCIKPSLKEYDHWRLVVNSFPYDCIAETHNMLIPKRHVTEIGLTDEESRELRHIKEELHGEYDYFIEAAKRNKSIPAHHHEHLIVAREGVG